MVKHKLCKVCEQNLSLLPVCDECAYDRFMFRLIIAGMIAFGIGAYLGYLYA